MFVYSAPIKFTCPSEEIVSGNWLAATVLTGGHPAGLLFCHYGAEKIRAVCRTKYIFQRIAVPGSNGRKMEWIFGNSNPVILELACGKGEYAVGLGQFLSRKKFYRHWSEKETIWVEPKSPSAKLKRMLLLRTQIDQVNQYFNTNEVSEIWITFPDPQLPYQKKKTDPSKVPSVYTSNSWYPAVWYTWKLTVLTVQVHQNCHWHVYCNCSSDKECICRTDCFWWAGYQKHIMDRWI